MSLNIIINTLPPGGLTVPGGSTLVLPGDLSALPIDPYGRRVLTTAQLFNKIDLRALYGRTPIYLQFLTIAAAPGSGVTGYSVQQLYTNAGQVIPLVLPGSAPEQAFVPNIYLDENAILGVVPQGTLNPVQAQLVLTIQPITQRDRSRLQCCYNGSPAIGTGDQQPPPEVLTISPNTVQTTDPSGVAIVSGNNFLPGDEVVLEFLGVPTPLSTVFGDSSTLAADYDPATLAANLYNVQVRRAGVLYPSTTNFLVQAV
jgi:hypothetical protein